MITTVTLNAAIDRTYMVDQFQVGRVHRIRQILSVPGGKGINVAKVAAELGEPVTASGFVGGANGRFIEEGLAERGIRTRMVRLEGESRVCLNILDPEGHSSTELLEQGPVVSSLGIDEFRQLYRELAGQSDIVVLSGSLPQGIGPDFYAELVKAGKELGAAVLVDTSGEALRSAAAAVPDLLKPNAQEFEQLVGYPVKSDEELYEHVMRFMNQGVKYMMVTLGEDGVVAGIRGQLFRAEALRVKAVNPVGCGDSFVAGAAAGIRRGLSGEGILSLAVAAAGANAMNQGAGHVRREDVAELLSQVAIRRIG